MGVWAPLQNLPALIVIMAGGFTTNCLWCVYLMVRNGTLGDYCHAECDGVEQPLGPNYLFSALAGVIWYLQFFFYGMGTTQMGAYKFTSWSLHMACIIIFSTLWGIALHEWRGTSRKTHGWIAAGLAVLVASTMVIGWGNKVSADEDAQAAPASARK
jgi:L-rhamnose-H+ transport protein